MTIYRIANWEASFETYETKKLTHLKWVPVPNKHDGLGFRRLAAQKNRCELFAAWNLILQVASKGRKDIERGMLIRDGRPLTPEDLAIMTGFPEPIFETALEFFSSSVMGWLVFDNQGQGEPAGKTAESRMETAEPPAEGIEGRNGIEGNGNQAPPEWSVGVKDGKKSAFIEIPERLRTPECRQAIEMWLAYKAEQKFTYKKVGLQSALSEWSGQFDALSFPDAVQFSIGKGWRGVYPRNATPQNGPQRTNGNPSISELRTVIQAKETSMAAIRRRYCSEVATGDQWNDDGKRREFNNLKREVRELTEKLAKAL